MALASLLAACGGDGATEPPGSEDVRLDDGGSDDVGAPRDAGGRDAGDGFDQGTGGLDAAAEDTGHADLGQPDAAAEDAGSSDMGSQDLGGADAGVRDAAPSDLGLPDAGAPDAGPNDGGGLDVGAGDAGPLDSGRPDAALGPDGGAPDAAGGDAGQADAGVGTTTLTVSDGQPYPIDVYFPSSTETCRGTCTYAVPVGTGVSIIAVAPPMYIASVGWFPLSAGSCTESWSPAYGALASCALVVTSSTSVLIEFTPRP